jgi:putative DNA primase/helicase
MTDLLARLKGVEPSGDGWTARCPAHEDRHNSLSVHHDGGRWLVKCHAGCKWRAITDALGMEAADLFDDEERGGSKFHPSDNRATAQPTSGASGSQIPSLTLVRYATLKGLPIDFLKTCGLSEFTYDHKPAVRVPYFGVGGEELAVRFRIAFDGDRFRWKKSGTKPCLYGLNRLAEARQQGQVTLVEGESDCHTLRSMGKMLSARSRAKNSR